MSFVYRCYYDYHDVIDADGNDDEDNMNNNDNDDSIAIMATIIMNWVARYSFYALIFHSFFVFCVILRISEINHYD